MYRLSLSTSPWIRIWDQHNGETLAGKSSHRNVKQKTKLDGSEWTCSMVDDISLAILKRHWDQGITILSAQEKFIFDIQLWSILTKLTNNHCIHAAKDIETSKFHKDTWNSYLRFWFGSALIPRDCYIIPWPTAVIWRITQRAGASIHHHP